MLRTMISTLLLLLCTFVQGQEKKDSDKVPAKVVAELKPWSDRLKDPSPSEIREIRKDEFIKTRYIASNVKITTQISDYADKPYVAKINWISHRQDSKIFSDKEKAEKTNEWLTIGKVAGNANSSYGSSSFTATFYYKDGKWELDTTKADHKHPWYDALKEVKKPQAKPN